MKKQTIFILVLASLSQAVSAITPQQIVSKIAASRLVQACTKTTTRKVATAYATLSVTMMINDASREQAICNKTSRLSEVPSIIKGFSRGPTCFLVQAPVYPVVKSYNNFLDFKKRNS